jgi:galactokinase
VLQALKVHREIQDLLVPQVQLEQQVLKAHKELQEIQVLKVLQEQRVLKVLKEMRDQLVLQEPQVLLDQQAQMEKQFCMVQ